MKRFAIAFAVLLALASHALAAGTISFSLSQQLDANGKPLANCRLQFIQAGTTATPQNAYKDAALTLPHPNPMRCDAAGRLDQFYLADGQIKIRLSDKNGLQILQADNLLVIGPSSGGGGGGGNVDPTTIMATGDIKTRYGTGSLSGFVRLNGRTIGNASSGATERGNNDTQALFEYLCANDNNLVMTPARSGNCANDYAANKVLAVPDGRGRVLAALDDMGAAAAGRLTATYFGATATVLGAVGGSESHTLTAAQIPAHTHPSTLNDPGHTHSYTVIVPISVLQPGGSGGSATSGASTTGSSTTGITITNAANTGGGGAHPIVPPMLLVTNYMKL